jgi:hypothetical protein
LECGTEKNLATLFTANRCTKNAQMWIETFYYKTNRRGVTFCNLKKFNMITSLIASVICLQRL